MTSGEVCWPVVVVPGAPTGYVIVRKAVTAKKVKVAQVEKPKKAKK